MHAHPHLGADYLRVRNDGLSREALLVIAQHHERHDGRGYPLGLAGRDISPRAALVSVADAYIAMREHRAYANRRSHHDAIAELQACSGTQFHSQFVDILAAMPASVAEQAVALLPRSPCENIIQEIAHAV